jgi:hypothetical protein
LKAKFEQGLIAVILRYCIVGISSLFTVTQFAAEEKTTKFYSLIENSPFGSPPRVADESPVKAEFRGYVVDDGQTFFCMALLQGKELMLSYWIKLGESIGPVTVTGFDLERLTVTVTQMGEVVALPLKHSQILFQPATSQEIFTSLSQNSEYTEEKRAEANAEEIRRRRIRRQEAVPLDS